MAKLGKFRRYKSRNRFVLKKMAAAEIAASPGHGAKKLQFLSGCNF